MFSNAGSISILKQPEQNSSAVLHNFMAATGKTMWNVSLCLCDRFNCKRTIEIAMKNDNQRLRTATIGKSYGTRARCHGRGIEATQSYERQVKAFIWYEGNPRWIRVVVEMGWQPWIRGLYELGRRKKNFTDSWRPLI